MVYGLWSKVQVASRQGEAGFVSDNRQVQRGGTTFLVSYPHGNNGTGNSQEVVSVDYGLYLEFTSLSQDVIQQSIKTNLLKHCATTDIGSSRKSQG
jgi:hypothetical protein